MALIKTKPTSPGRRFVVKADRSHLHKGEPVHALTSSQKRTGARNNQGRLTTRHKGGGHAALPCRRFRAQQGRGPGSCRAPGIRPEPQRVPRAGAVRRRRAPLHPRPEGRDGRRRDHLGRGLGDQAGQCARAAQHPARHADPQRGAEAGPRRPDCAQRRHLGAARGARRPVRDASACARPRCARCTSTAAPRSARWATRKTT